VAGLALFLVACSGETPTSPKPVATPGSGACNTVIALPAGPITTYAGTAISLRAQVTVGGVAAPDNSSVNFTTDLGFFNENSLPTISKTTRNGVADVSPGSFTTGTATVRAAFDCASATVQVLFQAPPDSGPFISLVQPDKGTSAGGETVVISGGRFGTAAEVSSVTFGGSPGKTNSVSNTSIAVLTPPRTLKDNAVPETVDVCVRYFSGLASVCKTNAYTYYAINPSQKMSVSSLAPTSGAPAGGDSVTILGVNFGSNTATTRVTFCGLSAQIVSMSDNSIGVTTPRKQLANPAVSETCDVVVTIDLGKVSTQSAVVPQAFTYRGSGGSATCGTDPSLYVSTISPNTGPPDGGTTVTIVGGGFPTNAAAVKVEFGGTAAQVLNAGANSIGVVTPRHTLADSTIPEVVDVVVTDLGAPAGTTRCARFSAGFTYTQQALTPTIYSVTPTVGPNDVSIPVTIAGDGFQYPENVYLTGGGCGTQLVPATVNTVSRSQIVFLSPLASGAGSTPCLAGSQMDVRVSNPSTGKSTTCPSCFRYGCPSVTSAAPSVLPSGTQTAVTIAGANFQSPVQAVFQAGGVPDYPLTVSSVTPSAIVVQMPPLSTIAPGQPACVPLVGNIVIRTTGLACPAAQASVTYRPDTPTLVSATPTTLSQDGSPSGAYGSGSATVTVSGSGFADPMTVVLTKDGVPVGSPVTATVTGSGTLTFKAPAVPDTSLNSATCASTPGGPLDGSQNVPTQFGIRVTNRTSGCSSDLPGVLVYNPRAQLAACTPNALDPVIYSLSPNTGPNDTPTLVTMSGANFQNPAKVYVAGGPCGSQLIEATVIGTATATQLTFQTPVASGPNSFPCLAGAQVDVQMLNPSGRKANLSGGFKYYNCLSVTGVSPAVIPTSATTPVVISGANFPSNVQATFSAGGVPTYQLTVSSVTPNSVTVQMPALSTLSPTLASSCQSVPGTIVLSSPTLLCNPVQTSISYNPLSLTLTSASPGTLNQDGSALGAPGTPAVVTVNGSGFSGTDPMTVVLTKDGAPVIGTQVNNVTVTGSGTLTFLAPAVPDVSLNTGQCSTTGGTVDGTQSVATRFGIRVTNNKTGCTSDLPAVLLYNPKATLAVCTPTALDPLIYSLSPNTGPNETPTLVTMSGLNFQNPVKVYVAGGACGGQLIEATVIGLATPTLLTFRTPLASGPGSFPCLSGAQVDVQVLNPSGRKANLSGGFKYYSCPSITGVSPSVISTVTTTTPVLISGANFPSNVQATFQAGGVPTYQLTVSSVTPNSVLVQMPPLATLSPTLASSCQSVAGTIVLSTPTLLCNPVQTTISYNPVSLTLTSASPGTLNQDGSSLGAPGTPALVTVNGSGFSGTDPMSVVLTKDGVPVAGTQVNSVTISGTGVLTFLAPAVPDASLNSGQCSTTGGAVDGTQSVATRFGIRVTNNKTGCTSDLPAALLYNPKATLAVCTANPLTPTINSISPTTGPNDSPTRVSIFGTGFQFPEQVFLTGGACGTQKIEVPVVAPVTLNQIVFQTPVAAGGYACLAGAQVDVQVLNPTTGKTANCPGCFKFYACPTATIASPSVLGINGGTVIVNGNNFQQPVEATFVATGQPPYRLTVTSVSSTSVVLQLPPYAAIVPGSPSCLSISGTINISSTGLSCASPAQVPLTYRPDPPTLSTAQPPTLPQDPGGTIVTVTGNFFSVGDPLRVTLTKDGGPVSGTTVSATVTANGVLVFTAPAIPDSAFNYVNCATPSPGPINGTKAVDTQFGIRVTNLGNGCSGDLPGAVIYTPRAPIAACIAALHITTAALSTASLCSFFNNSGTAIASTGGSPPYFYFLTGNPPWLSINPSTGLLGGTPNVLSPPLTGGSYPITFTVNVTDSVGGSTGHTFPLIVLDPGGPFSISGFSVVTIPPGGGSIPLSAFPTTGFTPYNWSFAVFPFDVGITLSSTTGTSISVNVAPGVTAQTYSISVQAMDTPTCGGATHIFTLPITMTKQ
jgi:hypothetical protein